MECCKVRANLYREWNLCALVQFGVLALSQESGYKIVGIWKDKSPEPRTIPRNAVRSWPSPRPTRSMPSSSPSSPGGSIDVDLVHTLQDLQAWGVFVVAQTGFQFDLRSAQAKLIASLMAPLAEFERALLRERVPLRHRHSAKAWRRIGRPVWPADRFAPKVLKLVDEGQSIGI